MFQKYFFFLFRFFFTFLFCFSLFSASFYSFRFFHFDWCSYMSNIWTLCVCLCLQLNIHICLLDPHPYHFEVKQLLITKCTYGMEREGERMKNKKMLNVFVCTKPNEMMNKEEETVSMVKCYTVLV